MTDDRQAAKMGPRTAEFHELHKRGDLTLGQIAKKMGLARGSIGRLVRTERAHLEGRMHPNTGRPPRKFHFEERTPTRCGRCFLFFPHECLPAIYQFAASRNGESTGLTE